MEISTATYGPVAVLRPSVRIDLTHSEPFQVQLLAAVEQHAPAAASVVVDFAGVDYISSVGLRALMVAAKKSKAQSGKLAVADLQGVVKEIFEISRFSFVLKIFPTVREAIAWMSDEGATAWDAAQK